jgi:hypothetical protein
MKGWKTWTGVLGYLITYVAGNMLGVDMQEAQAHSGMFVDMIQVAFGALTVVGLGHKVEKNGAITLKGKF